jgi:hypothetical protein
VVPKATPVIKGCADGAVAPPGINTAAGMTVSLDESPLANSTWTPPGGAGVVRLTGTGMDWLGPTIRLPGSTIEPDGTPALVSRKTAEVETPVTVAVTV